VGQADGLAVAVDDNARRRPVVVVTGGDDDAAVAPGGQGGRKAADDVGEAASLGKGSALGRDEDEGEGAARRPGVGDHVGEGAEVLGGKGSVGRVGGGREADLSGLRAGARPLGGRSAIMVGRCPAELRGHAADEEGATGQCNNGR